MQFFDVQITTDMGEVVVVQVAAGDRQEAEMTAIWWNRAMRGRWDAGWWIVLRCSFCLLFCHKCIYRCKTH